MIAQGSRLEFFPFKLQHHHQYKCLIKSEKSDDILRTLSFNSYSNIKEQNNRRPKMNLTIDTARLIEHDELRLICTTGKDYQHTLIMIIFSLLLLICLFCSFVCLFVLHVSMRLYVSDVINEQHQWIFDEQTPRSKVNYDLTVNNRTSVMIIPDFDLDVDSGNYQCSTNNRYGSTMREILVDKKTIRSQN
jgi:hypothetical protein